MSKYTELITAESILMALQDPDVNTRSKILQKIGTRSAATYYKRLEKIAKENKIELPETGNYNKKHAYHDEERLRLAAESSQSIKEVLEKLEVRTSNYFGVKRAAEKFNITLPKHNITEDAKVNIQKDIAEKILVLSSKRISGARLKRVIFFLELLENKCATCGLGPEWNGKQISLQIDHINGNNKDNRIENLRILCPNCHSQTETFAGKNKHSNSG